MPARLHILIYMNGYLVKEARKKLGLTQTQLGAALGLGKMTIWRWERGKGDPSTTALVALSFMLLVPRDRWPPIVADQLGDQAA